MLYFCSEHDFVENPHKSSAAGHTTSKSGTHPDFSCFISPATLLAQGSMQCAVSHIVLIRFWNTPNLFGAAAFCSDKFKPLSTHCIASFSYPTVALRFYRSNETFSLGTMQNIFLNDLYHHLRNAWPGVSCTGSFDSFETSFIFFNSIKDAMIKSFLLHKNRRNLEYPPSSKLISIYLSNGTNPST